MHLNFSAYRIFLTGIAFASVAHWPLHAEEMYKHVDEKGRVTYSNQPIKGGKKVDLPPISTVTIPKAEPKPDPISTPAQTSEARRKTLMEAIAKEEKALEEAKKAAKQGAENPETFKRTRTITGPDGKPQQVTETGRNVVAYEEKMKKLNAQVSQHETQLAKLKSELAALDSNPESKK